MPDQQKVYRLLRFLNLLSGSRTYSNAEIQERLELSERTIYRYLNTFEKAGLVVHRENGRYRLETERNDSKGLTRLFHFTREEVFIFWQIVKELEASSSTKNQLLRKLNTLYDINTLKQLKNSHELLLIKQLKEAIEQKRQVLLVDYRSSHSNVVKNRRLDAFEFLPDYLGFWAYEYSSKRCKQFKIARIGEVTILNESWEDEELHRVPFTDAFGMSSIEKPKLVTLQMRLMAYNLLIEEFPLAKKDIIKKNDYYILSIQVASFYGIGRFVLGLADEITKVEPKEFKEFLKGKINKMNW